MVVVEYAEHGNLMNYLRENRKQNYENMNECQLLLSVADRLKIAGEVARGMSHLAVMKVCNINFYSFKHVSQEAKMHKNELYKICHRVQFVQREN